MATLHLLPPPKDVAGTPIVGTFRRPMPPPFTSDSQRVVYQKGALALAARVMDGEGWGIGCGVALSARDALDKTLVWVLPRGKPLCTIKSADLVGVGLDGSVRHDDSGRGYDTEAYNLHLAIYAARPDVNGVTMGHTPHGRVFAAKGEEPKMLWQDSCVFGGKVHVLPFAAGLGENAKAHPEVIGEVLNNGKGLVLQNRGLLTVAGTIEGSTAYFIRLENLCGGQMLAEAAARGRGRELIYVGQDEVEFTQKNTGSEHHSWLMAMPYYTRVSRKIGVSGPLEM